MIARPLGCDASEQNELMVDLIQTASVLDPVAFTITSARWPIPRVTVSVVYGSIGTKSYAMTVRVWLSILKRCKPSAPALISRRRYVSPVVNWNFERPAFGVHVELSVTVEQSEIPFPLIRLLADEGAIRVRSVPITSSTMS